MKTKILEPGRKRYRKEIATKKGCQFCDAMIIKNQECVSLSGKFWAVLANKYPYMDGNLMLIPRRHVKNIEQLEAGEKQEFFEILEKSKKRLSDIFKTDDFNIGINIGKKAGASIEHIHWQIIPRKEKVLNSANIFGEILIITIPADKLKKIIDGTKTKKK